MDILLNLKKIVDIGNTAKDTTQRSNNNTEGDNKNNINIKSTDNSISLLGDVEW